MTRKRGIDFLVFQLIALKLGYWTRLNIMKERNNISGGKTNFHLPIWCSPSASQSRKSVIDAISPAAAGIGKPVKFLLLADPLAFRIGCSGVKTRQTHGPAGQVDKGDDPAGARKFLEHDPVNHQRRRDSERHNIGQRIEFATECAFVAAETGQPAVQEIKEAGAQNEPDGGVK